MARLTAHLCSQNAHKRAELQRALAGWTIVSLDATGYPPETGTTFADNARGKVLYGRSVGPEDVWMLGEDSGLELAALDGAPGVTTARWAQGRHVERVLAALSGQDDRAARYVCVLVALSPGGDETCVEGRLDGTIALAPRGAGGFGFDPVFVPQGETRTVAELGDDWKALHSHRARAAAALRAAVV